MNIHEQQLFCEQSEQKGSERYQGFDPCVINWETSSPKFWTLISSLLFFFHFVKLPFIIIIITIIMIMIIVITITSRYSWLLFLKTHYHNTQ